MKMQNGKRKSLFSIGYFQYRTIYSIMTSRAINMPGARSDVRVTIRVFLHASVDAYTVFTYTRLYDDWAMCYTSFSKRRHGANYSVEPFVRVGSRSDRLVIKRSEKSSRTRFIAPRMEKMCLLRFRNVLMWYDRRKIIFFTGVRPDGFRNKVSGV